MAVVSVTPSSPVLVRPGRRKLNQSLGPRGFSFAGLLPTFSSSKAAKCRGLRLLLVGVASRRVCSTDSLLEEGADPLGVLGGADGGGHGGGGAPVGHDVSRTGKVGTRPPLGEALGGMSVNCCSSTCSSSASSSKQVLQESMSLVLGSNASMAELSVRSSDIGMRWSGSFSKSIATACATSRAVSGGNTSGGSSTICRANASWFPASKGLLKAASS
mmetsp:Transcript_45804/g.99871  ORF Transcript_45804/g.99871 Transcript_45804/m.99871 type:complete len:216 (+) Transcript_45804:255-902(+)